MPSKLTGFRKDQNALGVRKLEWDDFGEPVSKPEPKPDERGTAAKTVMEWKVVTTPTIDPVAGSKPPVYRFSDTLEVAVKFDETNSWVAGWVFKRSKEFQQKMLEHERGHFYIYALIARDFFLDAIQLKGKTYKNAADGAKDWADVKARYNGKAGKTATLYDSDSETWHGTVDFHQNLWNGYFEDALTKERSPKQEAPDGAVYKVRLLDRLKQAGHTP